MINENEKYYRVALSTRVLAVAVVNRHSDWSDWSVYIDSVPGISHEREFMEVANHGSKLNYNIAKILFPILDAKYKWRD